ncbi:MAG: GlsB/YeaQ/YmgE family stress response membrane protein [Candidatus Vogelbacteria bacterium CG10_big_fil_rev_8_21_14_0_10_51_16]|uniref:GlsB/YeaQ/YmgE family stress response membrane protein n=1 Tax=Candidatus Vogelbacteria bacterium CG10_big_fil_rev_8_21_14_0_10_51_16 TaxID=1975045 RepID=A0A2H0RF87_9BACT|nr:MAG: GlsB/YeaQ/YmgE family stress response membrane protein [Candidatus Vogelbacteria bacterium CG10_big_fil_rev_8_21_14_0_10_51_16]
MLLDLIVWLALGAIVGLVAMLMDGGNARESLVGADIVAGIMGALLVGGLAYYLRVDAVVGFDFTSSVIALIGAIIASVMLHRFHGTGNKEPKHLFQH